MASTAEEFDTLPEWAKPKIVKLQERNEKLEKEKSEMLKKQYEEHEDYLAQIKERDDEIKELKRTLIEANIQVEILKVQLGAEIDHLKSLVSTSAEPGTSQAAGNTRNMEHLNVSINEINLSEIGAVAIPQRSSDDEEDEDE